MRMDRAGLQTRTEKTVAAYLRRATNTLTRLAAESGLPDDTWPEPESVVEFLRVNASVWKWATFRQHQASLACFYEHEAEQSGDTAFQRIAEAIRRLPWDKCKAESQVGKTSSKKRKGIPERDFSLLIGNLDNPPKRSRWSRVTARWLLAAVPTGLRPGEWDAAELNVDPVDEEGTLKVINAKATNGRANGKTRTIPLSAQDVVVVRAHLESLQALKAEGYDFETIHRRCSRELHRACVRIWGEPRTANETQPEGGDGSAKEGAGPKRFSLYSARHQFSANMKAGESQERVAELLGHASVRTARRHYAPRRRAWLKWRDQTNAPQAKPDAPTTTPATPGKSSGG